MHACNHEFSHVSGPMSSITKEIGKTKYTLKRYIVIIIAYKQPTFYILLMNFREFKGGRIYFTGILQQSFSKVLMSETCYDNINCQT